MKIKKVTIIFLVFSFIYFSSGNNKLNSQKNLDWETLDRYWTKYTKIQNNENAKNLYSALPCKVHNDQRDLKIINKIASNLNTLEKLILQRNQHALKIAFRLINISDGSFAEELCMIIGKSILIDSDMFLEELSNHYKKNDSRLGSILSIYEPGLSENIENEINETKRRIESLKKNSNLKFIKLRDLCVKILGEILVELINYDNNS